MFNLKKYTIDIYITYLMRKTNGRRLRAASERHMIIRTRVIMVVRIVMIDDVIKWLRHHRWFEFDLLELLLVKLLMVLKPVKHVFALNTSIEG